VSGPAGRHGASGEAGQTTVEWALIMAAIGLPLFWVFMMLLDLLTAHYRMVTFIETLPFP
jgi:hypothetical protein